MDTFTFIVVLILAGVIAIGGNFLAAQIPGEGRARSAAENVGIENPRVTKRVPAFEILLGCKSDDVTKFTVEGTRNGRPAKVEVCAPLIGGYTVRS